VKKGKKFSEDLF